MSLVETLGLIAGNRTLPLVLARQAKAMGVRRLVAAGFTGETDPALAGLVDEMVWLKVGQLGKLIDTFSGRGVRHCVMAGQIAPRNLFDLRPDLRAVSLLLRLKEKNAHTLFGAIAEELAREGIELIEATPWLQPLMAGEGFRLGPELTAEQRDDAALGFKVAKEISRLEVGQIVVVRKGTILAVEGFEGTDACLQRGGALAGKDGGALAVKVAKEKHDMRFDIPCIGPRTLEICAEARLSALLIEGGRNLVLEQETVAGLARRHKVTVATIC